VSTYLVLIHGDEQYWDAETPEQRAVKEAAHRAFAEAAGDALIDGRELGASGTSKTLRGGGSSGNGSGERGRPLVTDGPFAETKEVVGGYYVLRVADLDAAIALASMLPELGEPHGAVELRPIVEPED